MLKPKTRNIAGICYGPYLYMNMLNGNDVSAFLNSRYKKISEDFKTPGKRIIASHMGEITQDKVSALAYLVESQMEQQGVSKSAVKKIFNIVIETLQNILLHGEKDEHGTKNTFFVIGKDSNDFVISSGNLIQSGSIENVRSRLQKIIDMNESDLKKHYLEVLSNGELSAKGGAGLGFLTIAMKSGNKINYNIENINDRIALFLLQSKVHY